MKMTNNINIVQIAAHYPPYLGGLERVAQEVAEHLARNGHKVSVLTSNIQAKEIAQIETRPNLAIRRLSAFHFAHTTFIPSLLWELLRVRKPAIFHLHLAQAYVPEMVWLAAKLRNIPYIVHFHIDAEPSGRLGFLFVLWKRWVQSSIIKDATRVITLSLDQSNLIHERYQKPKDKITFIGNGVGREFLEIGKTNRVFHTPLRLIFVGRLSVQKRPERLVEALALVNPGVTLDIVGEGEDRAELESLVAKLKLTNVKFLGKLHGKELLEAYRNADVFVLSSDREGMPLVLLEAMSTGLPIIGSNVLGIRELISEVGVLVDNPSSETFAKAINNLLERPGELQRLSQKSIAKSQGYSWEILIKQLEKVYEEILEQKV